MHVEINTKPPDSPSPTPDRSVSVFVVCHPCDSAHLAALEVRLAPMVHSQTITFVSDASPGEHHNESFRRLENSDVVLLLLSPDLVAADGLVGTLFRASERPRPRQIVVPILIRPCSLWGSRLQQRELLRFNQSALTSAADLDKAWHYFQVCLFELFLTAHRQLNSDPHSFPLSPLAGNTANSHPDGQSISRWLAATLSTSDGAAQPACKSPNNSLLYRMISSPKDAVGASFRQYRILDFLGRGGTGACYRVLNTTLGRELCLKLTYPLARAPQAIMTAVSRTVRALGAIDHPSVIKLHDFGVMEIEGDLTFYLSMDLLSRETMWNWSRRLALTEILAAYAKVANALHAAHTCRFFDEVGFEQVGLLHGDIKPDNIVISLSGQPVVTDFMMPDFYRIIAQDARKRLFDPGGPFLRAATTSECGTPGFMPPEQEDRGLVTARSDIFALGRTVAASMEAHGIELSWTPSQKLVADVQHRLERLLEYLSLMMRPQPEERPASMDQVCTRLWELAGELT